MKIISIDYDSYKTRGCETCDYGAVYIDDISITWDDGVKVQFCAESDYKIMSESEWMILLANTSSREEIIKAWKDKHLPYVEKDNGTIYYIVSRQGSNESTRNVLIKEEV